MLGLKGSASKGGESPAAKGDGICLRRCILFSSCKARKSELHEAVPGHLAGWGVPLAFRMPARVDDSYAYAVQAAAGNGIAEAHRQLSPAWLSDVVEGQTLHDGFRLGQGILSFFVDEDAKFKRHSSRA